MTSACDSPAMGRSRENPRLQENLLHNSPQPPPQAVEAQVALDGPAHRRETLPDRDTEVGQACEGQNPEHDPLSHSPRIIPRTKRAARDSAVTAGDDTNSPSRFLRHMRTHPLQTLAAGRLKPIMRLTTLGVPLLFCAATLGATERPNIVIVFARTTWDSETHESTTRARRSRRRISMRWPSGACASRTPIRRPRSARPRATACLPDAIPGARALPQGIVNSWGGPVIEENRLTLGKALQAKGYRTACIGKWHLGWGNWPVQGGGYLSDELEGVNVGANYERYGERIDFRRPVRSGPTTRGFDYYFGDDVPNFPPYVFLEDDRVLGDPTDRMPVNKGQRAGPMLPRWDLWTAQPTITARAVAWLAERAAEPDQPFFLYMPLLGPHTPIVPNADHRGKSAAGPYGDWVHQMDAALGQIVATLEAAGSDGKHHRACCCLVGQRFARPQRHRHVRRN